MKYLILSLVLVGCTEPNTPENLKIMDKKNAECAEACKPREAKKMKMYKSKSQYKYFKRIGSYDPQR